jgi:hypothetical protein
MPCWRARAREQEGHGAKIRAVLDQAVTVLKDEPPRVRAEAHRADAVLLASRGEWRGAYDESRKALELSGMRFH